MHRLLAILLIPFFLVGNSLAHSHGSATHQSPSQGRAHIHIGSGPEHGHSHDVQGHSHHGHSHGHDRGRRNGQTPEQDHKSDHSTPTPADQPIDHDSDAIYVAASDFVGTTSARISIELGSCGVVEVVDAYWTGNRSPSWLDRPPLAMSIELPLYLLHAALRL